MTALVAETESTSLRDSSHAGVEVRLDDLRRQYGSVNALDGLNLTIGAGELVALLGPSGCGKTTALRLVAGLEDADGGRVVIGGKDVTDLPANRRDAGMVFQAYSLFPHMTARQNVAFGLRMARSARRSVSGGRERCWSWSGCRPRRIDTPTRCRVVSSSGSRSPARLSSARGCCCLTSRCELST